MQKLIDLFVPELILWLSFLVCFIADIILAFFSPTVWLFWSFTAMAIATIICVLYRTYRLVDKIFVFAYEVIETQPDPNNSLVALHRKLFIWETILATGSLYFSALLLALFHLDIMLFASIFVLNIILGAYANRHLSQALSLIKLPSE